MTNRSPGQIGLPPPAMWTLMDGDRGVGWTADNAVGFRGFGSHTEAVHAAWVAYRALAHRLARTHGTRPVPIDGAALAVQRRDEREWILADGRPIAALVRYDPESAGEPDSFGFEIEVPHAADDLEVQSLAHLMYRTLRRSGLRWALWRSDERRNDVISGAAAPAGEGFAATSPERLTPAAASDKRRRRRWTLPMSLMSAWWRSPGRRPSYAGGAAGGTND